MQFRRDDFYYSASARRCRFNFNQLPWFLSYSPAAKLIS